MNDQLAWSVVRLFDQNGKVTGVGHLVPGKQATPIEIPLLNSLRF